ncbi:hypothetical protein ASE39_06270 [Acidovorax sp. Root267]|uniref:DUF2147 domain-containing protein n=1 Tax=Acidovorax sp. Root267 TaxID=1736505 RepID=UPI00070F09B9|nr:DUF2147 domain-containing protein [Acidovorax sp. Root267]KRD21996.1 hypothetical protein ASE39_06270 [Acidovorax sp. Root267]
MKPFIALAAAALALGWAHAASAQEAAAQPATTALAASASVPHPQAPLGRWITESGNLEVDVAPCATDAKNTATSISAKPGGSPTLCGKVVRVLAHRSMSAPGTDMAAADARPALGMTLLSGLRDTGSGSGDYQGEIYNRENAKTYRATLTPAEPDQLLVRAYVGIPLFGKTQVWRRPAAEHGGAP